MSSNIYVFFLHIPGHTKVSYFTHLSFTDQYISSCQIAVDYLSNNQNYGIKKKSFHRPFVSRPNSLRPEFYFIRIMCKSTN